MFSRLKAILQKPRNGIADAKSILYTSPSIEDAVGPITRDTTTINGRIVIETDNWRHTELVHAGFSQEIHAELADISTIHQQHRQASGWDKVHIRRRIAEPVRDVEVRLPDLVVSFQAAWSRKASDISIRQVSLTTALP